jgi:uncharacterized protein YyaL (SSP411 family)
MVSNLVQLYLLTGDEPYRRRAEVLAQSFAGDLSRNLLGHCGLLAGCMDLMAPIQIVLVGGASPEMRRGFSDVVRGLSIPGAVVQVLPGTEGLPKSSPLADKKAVQGQVTAYVCVGSTCSAPVTDADQLKPLLLERRLASAGSVPY